MYDYNGTDWVPTRLVATTRVASGYYGTSVVVSDDGNTVVVGSPACDIAASPNTSPVGAVYVYTRSGPGSSFTETMLNPSDATNSIGATLGIAADGLTFVTGRSSRQACQPGAAALP